MLLLPHCGQLEVGDLIATKKSGGLIKHFGVFVGYGVMRSPVVVSSSGRHGRVVAETLTDFCGGHLPEYFRVAAPRLDRAEITRRALNAIGARYDLFGFNCEHFVHYAHGYPIGSPQVRSWLALTGSVATILSAAAYSSRT